MTHPRRKAVEEGRHPYNWHFGSIKKRDGVPIISCEGCGSTDSVEYGNVDWDDYTMHWHCPRPECS